MEFTLSETSKGQFNGECCNIGCCFPLNNCTDNLLLYFSGIGFVRMVVGCILASNENVDCETMKVLLYCFADYEQSD
jgi:hypothetical protein